MKEEIIDRVILDRNYDSYQAFFDKDWAERVYAASATTQLKQAAGDFVALCRYASEAHRLPWLMVAQLRKFAEGESRGSFQFRASYSERVVKELVDKLESRMHANLNIEQRLALKRVVKQLEAKAYKDLKEAAASVKLDSRQYWEHILNAATNIPFSIFGIQRNNYLAMFFAYEDFVVNSIRTKDAKYTSSDRKTPIGKALETHFGAALSGYCWDTEIDLARLVRNALVHHGGRYTSKLDPYKDRFVDESSPKCPIGRGDLFIVVNRKVQITPANTKRLYDILKDRVLKIVDEVK